MNATRQDYTEEFKKEAVRLVVEEGYTQKEAGTNLGISPKNITRWKKVYTLGKGKGERVQLSRSEREELEQLRKENRRLKMERDILKKAAAFFASEGL